MTLTNNYARGSQLWIHKVRMIGQALSVNFKLALMVGVLVFGGYGYQNTTSSNWSALQTYGMAELLVATSFGDPSHIIQTYQDSKGNTRKARATDILKSPYFKAHINHLKQSAISGFIWGFLATFGIIFGVFCFFLIRGKSQAPQHKDRGSSLEDPKTVLKLLKNNKEASPFKLGDLPLVKDKETSHFLVTGTTGSGKSNCINTLLSQIRALKQSAIIVDLNGSFVEKFYRDGTDTVLNPFDTRSVPWDLWAECKNEFDTANFASAIVPPSKEGGPFWREAARTVLISAINKYKALGSPKTTTLYSLLLSEKMPLYSKFFEGTQAAPLTAENGDKMALSVRATLSNQLHFLKYIEDAPGGFSIRHWIQIQANKKEDSWVFLSCRPDQRDVLRPYISALIDTSVSSLMGELPDPNRRLWFIMDELPALNALPSLPTALAEIRKYGGCIVAGIQSKPQLESIYGRDTASSLLDLFNTQVYFRSSEPSTTAWISKVLGEAEKTESLENLSYGANTIRDGVSLNQQQRTKPVVMATEIANLKDLEAFIRLPGGYPITKIKMAYCSLAPLAKPFINKEILPVVHLKEKPKKKNKTHSKIEEKVKKIKLKDDLPYF